MSVTYLTWWGFSINEGGGPVNIHMSWIRSGYWFYFYIFIFGWRYYKIFERRNYDRS